MRAQFLAVSIAYTYLFLFHNSRFKIIVNLSALNVNMCNLGAVVTFKIKSLLTYLCVNCVSLCKLCVSMCKLCVSLGKLFVSLCKLCAYLCKLCVSLCKLCLSQCKLCVSL